MIGKPIRCSCKKNKCIGTNTDCTVVITVCDILLTSWLKTKFPFLEMYSLEPITGNSTLIKNIFLKTHFEKNKTVLFY